MFAAFNLINLQCYELARMIFFDASCRYPFPIEGRVFFA